ncbi:cellulose biosynthesis protein BcsQ [Trinickia fusca]|uniref:Cellulose synthase operon protein YhjQ n=1 Tax=Trinickia fusca TaxID=2419777 RepID=A0A494XAU6_9BURK|nr:cellulose biosynthesis protein BcsQ [Trinickia fusca]RKP45234.1 cellulose synthase operon protein YhjQ [Trinickia fusca]
MKTIALVSTAGGTGRTTLTAALAVLLARRRRAVVAVDFDPQNLLGAHLGLDTFSKVGLADAMLGRTAPWREHTWRNDEGVLFAPHGELALDERTASEARLVSEPRWLAQALAQIDLPDSAVAFVDTPRYPSPQAAHAVRCADLVLCLTPPEPAACATLVRHLAPLRRASAHLQIVVNRLNPARDMQRDALSLLQAAVGATTTLDQRVHLDAAMPEAFARGTWFFDDAPHSQAAHDLQGLANWLDTWLGPVAARGVTRKG